MKIDLALLAVVALFGFMGWRSGAILQLSHWTGLLCGWLLSGPAAARLTPMAAPVIGFSAPTVNVVLTALLFVVIGAAASLLTHSLLSALFGKYEQGNADRGAGFVLGVGKGGAILFVLLSFALFFEKPLNRAFGRTPKAVADSSVVGFVRRHSLFEAVSLPAVAKLEKLMAAERDPKSSPEIARDPELQSLLKDPALQSALKSEGAIRALLSGDLTAIKNNPRLAVLLKDARFSGTQAAP
jgi:uncharacterized membrane protein required for colicin V production